VPLHAREEIREHDHQRELAEVRSLQAEETEIDPAPGTVDRDPNTRDARQEHR